MSFSDALMHAFTTLAAGGFSSQGRSFEAFSSSMSWIAVVFMAFAGMNFALLFRAFTGRTRALWQDLEFKVYLGIVLVSALLALAASDSNTHFVYLAYLPSMMFWILDGYFLWQERLFRKLYDRVRIASESEIDFSMDTSSVRGEVSSWIGTMFSRTLLIYHGTILGVVVVITVITLSSNP